MTHGTDFKLINLLHTNKGNITPKVLTTSIEKPGNRRNIHLVLYDTLTSRRTPSSNGQLSYCACSFGILEEFHQYKNKNSVNWQIVMNAKIGFKLVVTPLPGFYSLNDWWYQMVWLFSGGPDNPQYDTVMEKHSAEALHSAVKGLMHAIHTEGKEARQDVVHQMIQSAKGWTVRRWLEFIQANRILLVLILMENVHFIDSEWTEDNQAKLKTCVQRYTSLGASGAWRVNRWRLGCFLFVLGDTEDYNEVSGQWYDKWPDDTRVYYPILWRPRETFLPILVNDRAEVPKPDQDDESRELLLPEQNKKQNTLSGPYPPQTVVLFHLLSGQVRHFKWWPTVYF